MKTYLVRLHDLEKDLGLQRVVLFEDAQAEIRKAARHGLRTTDQGQEEIAKARADERQNPLVNLEEKSFGSLMKREADKRHSRLWFGTVGSAMIEVGNVLQSSNVKSIKVTVERNRKCDSWTNLLLRRTATIYRIDVRR